MTRAAGFIGLGVMGLPMARNLLAKGVALTVHSRSPEPVDAIVADGATRASAPAEVAAATHVTILMLPDDAAVADVVEGPGGVLEGAAPGHLLVDMSTVSPERARRNAELMRAAGGDALDAPVSGGDVGARNATLAIMVGGDADAFARVRPLLQYMGKTITHCGPSGAGQLTKLVNQILVSVTNLAVCEALTFAATNGLDLAKTIQAVAGGAAGSWQLQNLGPKMTAGDFAPGFTIDLQQKDLRLVMQAAGESHTPLPAASLVHQLFASAQSAGRGKDGTQALYTVLQRLASR
jgi:3-hydroxyisobutyrate dehydrogenase